MVPLCPLEPITPIGSTSFREGILAGQASAATYNAPQSNYSENHRNPGNYISSPHNYNPNYVSPIQSAMKAREHKKLIELEERRLKLEQQRLENQQNSALPEGWSIVHGQASNTTIQLTGHETSLPNGQIITYDPITDIYSIK